MWYKIRGKKSLLAYTNSSFVFSRIKKLKFQQRTHTLRLPWQSRSAVTAVIHFSLLSQFLSQAHDTGLPISHAASSLGQGPSASHQAENVPVNQHHNYHLQTLHSTWNQLEANTPQQSQTTTLNLLCHLFSSTFARRCLHITYHPYDHTKYADASWQCQQNKPSTMHRNRNPKRPFWVNQPQNFVYSSHNNSP